MQHANYSLRKEFVIFAGKFPFILVISEKGATNFQDGDLSWKCIHSLPQRYHRKCLWLAYPFYIFSQIFMKLTTGITSQENPKAGRFWSLALVLCPVNIYMEYKDHVHSHSTVLYPLNIRHWLLLVLWSRSQHFNFFIYMYLYHHFWLFGSYVRFVWFDCLIRTSGCPHIFESDRLYRFDCEIPSLCCS